ncbi:4744_t:CDS:2, partial [Scutellospora calospora]
MRHAQKEKRMQKNKPSSNSTSEFSKDNPYISNSAENTEKSMTQQYQKQMIIESFSSTSPKAVNKNSNTEQNSDSIEINADSDSKEEPFTI